MATLTHKLTYNGTTTTIDEPIGFDDLQVHIQRHNYHGMGAEVSIGDLEFYGNAHNIIKTAYDADIDSNVVYSVVTDNAETVYYGQVDLSTCSFVESKYASVKAKVGEIGDMTTFNNRVNTEIDIDDPKTVDGSAVTSPTWRSLHIPMKHLLYTNLAKQKTDVTYETIPGGTSSGPYSSDIPYATYENRYFHVPLNGDVVNEFSQFGDEAAPLETSTTDDLTPQYIASEDHTTKYGSNTEAHIDAYFDIDVYVHGYIIGVNNQTIWFKVAAKDASGNEIEGTRQGLQRDTTGEWLNVKCKLSGDLTATDSIKFYLKINGDTNRGLFKFKIKKGSYYKMTMYDNLAEDENYTDMLLVHDALNVVSHAISENALGVKSEWYRTPDSYWNNGSVGGGALKALTNGYHIRGLFADGSTKRNLPLSFKTIIEALDALDCIGWGFSTEDNQLCVRVERWDWFYKDTTILTLSDVAEVTTDVLTDRIATELKIGYKKYATQDQYNSIDSPHGTRTFTNGIKALNNAITRECEFVADNFAIEETRRARTNVNETEETTYDENIFVFELQRYQPPIAIPAEYSIVHSARNASNVGRASEFINAKLTPRHMAARWRSYLFAANNTSPFRFTSGEINYKSSFGTIPENTSPVYNTDYLESFAITYPQVENDDITHVHAKFKAEKITFSYPLTIAQYNTVKANPYGLVSVNGVLGWIMNFKYKLEDGMADFTLIAKYTN